MTLFVFVPVIIMAVLVMMMNIDRLTNEHCRQEGENKCLQKRHKQLKHVDCDAPNNDNDANRESATGAQAAGSHRNRKPP